MTEQKANIVQKVAIYVVGCMLAALGTATLFHPEFMVRYGLEVATPEARIATRALIGGGELGFSLILLFGGSLQFNIRQRLVLATLLFFAIFTARALAVLLEYKNALAPIVYRELFAEFIILVVLSAVVLFCRKRS